MQTSPEWGSGCPWPGSHHGPCRAARGSSQRLGDMCIVGSPAQTPHHICFASGSREPSILPHKWGPSTTVTNQGSVGRGGGGEAEPGH